jgi:hypothetical protein
MAFPNYGVPSPTAPNQGKVPQGGLAQILQSVLGQGGKRPGEAPGNPEPGTAPADMPAVHPLDQPGLMGPEPPMIPGAPPMPGPGGPMQSAGMMPGGMSPEEHAALIEQIKGELMKQMSGQSGQQDQVFSAARGLASYRPMGNPGYPKTFQQAPGAPPYVPPGSVPAGAPLPPQGMPPRPMPLPVPPTNYGPYQS